MRGKKVVYILGAGASKDFGLPLGNEYFSKASYLLKRMHNDQKPKGYIQNSLEILKKELPAIYPHLSSDTALWPPLEEILTVSHILKKENIFSETVKFASLILTSCHGDSHLDLYNQQGTPKFSYVDRYFQEVKFFRSILSEQYGEPTFISFNYDIILDLILQEFASEVPSMPKDPPKVIADYSYGTTLFDINNKIQQIREKGVQLLKPHGSINLAYCDNCKKTYYFVENLTYPILNERSYCFCNCASKLRPLIIPPSYGKAQKVGGLPSNYMNNIFERAKMAIAKANKIVIIGYSFPSYDIEVKSWLLESIALNNNMLTWEIIDQGNSIRDSLENILPSNTIIYSKGFISYIEEFNRARSNP